MHIGLGLQMANLDRKVSDADVYRLELGLAARAEEVGFDSVWVSEHHFSDYQLTSQQSMILSWLAAQTNRIKLGTFVTVLPWHDPVRVAEQFSVLDHLSGGRAILGLGRGLGQKEFVGFRVPMGESRRRFKEYSEALLEALETGVMEYDGELYQQPRVEIRPQPAGQLQGPHVRVGGVAGVDGDHGPHGRGAPGHRPEAVGDDRGRAGGLPAPVLRVERRSKRPSRYWSSSPASARTRRPIERMRNVYLQRWARSTVEHYEFDNVGFADIEGYEYYGALANNIAKHGVDRFNGFLADLQVWGTPEQVTEKLLSYVERTDAGGLVCPLVFGGMPPDEARACFDLFADRGRSRSSSATTSAAISG